MFPFTVPAAGEPEGDFRRRQALRSLISFLILLPLTIAAFRYLAPIWERIVPLEGASFLLAATALGLALAFLPLLTLAFGMLAMWHGVESIERPRSRHTPWLDRVLAAIGLAVWFAPTLGLLSMAGRALLEGAVRFHRPAVREYALATDPIAFWQGIGFLLIVAVAVAWPAVHYWRGKFARFPKAQSRAL